MTGVIFDFNGTMFDDSSKQRQVWLAYAEKTFHRTISEEEFGQYFWGRNTEFSLQYLAGHPMGKKELYDETERLEEVYRNTCDAEEGYVRFTEDTIRLLDRLKEKGIPLAIATASPKSNVDWYWERFCLEKWFEMDNIVYDDGTIAGKPNPDFYLRAAEKIGRKPEECIVFEDAVSGIESARRAGIGKIIAKAPEGKKDAFRGLPGVYKVIGSFDEVDYSLLEDGLR